MRKSRFLIAISSAALALIASTLAAPAQALNVIIPDQWANFPACSQADENQMCVETFMVDVEGDGYDNPAETLSLNAYLFDIHEDNSASLAIYINNNGWQELSPTLPTGSEILMVINTRDWKPSSQAFSTSKVNHFVQEQNEAGDWITQAEVSTSSMAFATECYQEDCSNPQDRIDYVSKADFLLFDLGQQTAYDKLFDGMFISSNATSTIWPTYNSETMTWVVDTAGPALTDGGDENVAYFNAFFPDSAIIAAYGADPQSMVGVFKVLRKDGSKTIEQEINISHVEEPVAGILLEIPAYSFSSNDVITAPLSVFGKNFAPLTSNRYTSPQHKIKPKVKLMSAPSLYSISKSSSSATLKGSKLSGASSYQGVCVKGSKIKYGTANNPVVKVKNLTKGNWSCRIRGVKKIGGKWSSSRQVKIS